MTTKSNAEIRPGAVYTLEEARMLLGVSDATLRRWIKSGAMPNVRVGRAYRFLGQTLIDALTPAPVRLVQGKRA